MRALFLSVLLVLGGAAHGYGQSTVSQSGLYGITYRPNDASYLVGRYPHFDLIYQAGTEETAFEIATRLEDQLAATQAFVGEPNRRLRMPVVVNGFTDRSNGFVSPFPFRQEIEAVSIKSDALTTPFPSWPAAVAPHELVHAAHAEIQGGVGVGGLVRFLGPDWSRIINLTAPSGLIEGAAVYRESQLFPGAGRLHAPLATMAFRAAMLSDDPWSLTQMLEAPAFTRPFDRHYVGGGHAFAYLTERDDDATPRFFHRATQLHHRLPFLGFGVGLWHGTGTNPQQLNDEMREAMVADVRARHVARQPFTDLTVIDGEAGLEYRRPHWINDSTLVAHARGYDVRSGFYTIDAATGRRTLISAQQIAEDAVFTLAPDSTALYFTRYVSDLLVTQQAWAEVHRLSLSDGDVQQLTYGGRAHAPVSAPDGRLWALPNDGAGNQWGGVQSDGTVAERTDLADVRFEQVAPSPQGDDIAVLLNVQGHQRLYRARWPADASSPCLVPWLGVSSGSMYDINWGPHGRYLLFSAEQGGRVNLFALDTQTDTVRQLTHVAFGALEPTVSPDGSRLAFVDYQHERFNLAQIPFRPETGRVVPDSSLLRSGDRGWVGQQAAVNPKPPIRSPAQVQPYRPARRLAPRLVYPTIAYDFDGQNDPLGLKIGAGIASTDPLQQWAYLGEAFVQANRLWGRAQIQTGRHWLRPRLALYNEPTAAGSFGIEERGVALRIGTPITFKRNTSLTQLQLQLSSAIEQARLINGRGDALSDFATRWTVRPAAVLGYKLERNLRDLVPRRGLVLRGIPEVDMWSTGQGRRGLFGSARVYVPLLRRSNTGFSLYARLLTQNQSAVLSANPMLPRGHGGRGLDNGTFATLGAEVVQPLTYIDDGITLVPLYIKALYAYGFGETLQSVGRSRPGLSAIGAGIGVQFRFFYALDFDVRIGAAYRFAERDVHFITR